jgi:ankyrin repeat protein
MPVISVLRPGPVLCLFIMIAALSGCAAPTPLDDAIRNRDNATAAALIGSGTGLDERDANLATPLHWAAETNDLPIAKLLIDKRVNIQSSARNAVTPLYLAALHSNIEIAHLLIGAGAIVDSPDDADWTPLMAASRIQNPAETVNQPRMVEFLLAQGASPRARSVDGWTPLHVAAELPDPRVAQMLLAKGADVSAVGPNGLVPLDNASISDRRATAFALLDAGAHPEITAFRPEIGARAYRFAAEYAESKGNTQQAIAYWRAASAQFAEAIGNYETSSKAENERGNEVVGENFERALLAGFLAGLGHTTIFYQIESPEYHYAKARVAQIGAAACRILAADADEHIRRLGQPH